MLGRGLVHQHSQDWPTSRRAFGRLLVGLFVAAPRIAIAQGSTVVRRIGRLVSGKPDTPEEMWKEYLTVNRTARRWRLRAVRSRPVSLALGIRSDLVRLRG